MPSILTFSGVTKRFPGVTALDDVSFEIARGECHGIVGENGAGKSTLGRVVAGIHHADRGRLFLHGREVSFRSPSEAARAGVSIVHQELAFCPNLSVAENLFLGALPASRGIVRWAEMRERSRGILQQVGLSLDPSTPISLLSTAQEQLIQVAVATSGGARIIIMDEPTSSLSQAEADRLFGIIQRLRGAGITVLYISHRLEEVQHLCDRITVLRDGRFIQTVRREETSTGEIVRLMIGRSLEEYFPTHVRHSPGGILLSVKGLTSAGKFHDVSFVVRAGEIVGLAGLVGAGRSELARAIFGIEPYTAGAIELQGSPFVPRSPQDAIARGIGLLPEDRKRQGLVLTMTCRENVSLAMLERLRRRLLIDHARDRALSGEYFARLQVRAPHVDVTAAALSGGNQQKIALAKWLARRCRLLILDEPTRGVDVGAKAEIHGLIDGLATGGHGILLISSELPEILNLCTRVLVMADGRIVGELRREQADQESLMRLMTGLSR